MQIPPAPVRALNDEAAMREELENAHGMLDALGAGEPEDCVGDRLIDWVRVCVGVRAAELLDGTLVRALARHHIATSQHDVSCPCTPCRAARILS